MSFLLEVGQILAGLGREVEVDADARMLAVETELEGHDRLLVLVRPMTRAVTIYAVHPRPVPAERLAAMAELLARANSTEFTVAIELDHEHGSVTTRAGLELFGTELPDEDLEQLIAVLVVEVESVAQCYAPAIDAVTADELTPKTGATQGLAARRDERFSEATTALEVEPLTPK